jgi:hypothetical protein
MALPARAAISVIAPLAVMGSAQGLAAAGVDGPTGAPPGTAAASVATAIMAGRQNPQSPITAPEGDTVQAAPSFARLDRQDVQTVENPAGSRSAGEAARGDRAVAPADGEDVQEDRPEGRAGLSLSHVRLLVNHEELLRNLDRLREAGRAADPEREAALAGGVAGGVAVSIGYVVWLVRSGVLLSSVLSALPAWQLLDPLPVLARSALAGRRDGDGEGDADGVERMFGIDPDARPGASSEDARAATPPGRADPLKQPPPPADNPYSAS